jgi:hypothetical protein
LRSKSPIVPCLTRRSRQLFSANLCANPAFVMKVYLEQSRDISEHAEVQLV